MYKSDANDAHIKNNIPQSNYRPLWLTIAAVTAAAAAIMFFHVASTYWNNFLNYAEINILSVASALIIYLSLNAAINIVESSETARNKITKKLDKNLPSILVNTNMQVKEAIINLLGYCDEMKEELIPHDKSDNINKILSVTGLLENYINNIINVIEIDTKPSKMTTHASFRQYISPILDRSSIYARWNNVTLEYEINDNVPNIIEADFKTFKTALQNCLYKAVNQNKNRSIFVQIYTKKHDKSGTFIHAKIIKNTSNEISKSFLAMIEAGKKSFLVQPNNNYEISTYVTHKKLSLADGQIQDVKYNNALSYTDFYLPYNEPKNIVQLNNSEKINKRAKKQPKSADKTKEQNEANISPYILLVDDHPANIMLLHKYMKSYKNSSIDEACDGRQAIHKYLNAPYDIIFMDCQMPEIDGLRACQRIRQIEKENNLKNALIIGVTADTTRATRKKCLDSGMDDIIYKPITREQLDSVIKSHTYIEEEEPEKIVLHMRNENKNIKATQSENKNAQMPVNLKRLRSYTEGDKEEEKIFFNIFLEQAAETLTVLEATLKNHNETDWCRAAHKLKGSSANLGAEQLAELCQMAEHHDTSIADEDILQAIKSELNKVDNFLNALSKNNVIKENHAH